MTPLTDGELGHVSAEARLDEALEENRRMGRALDECGRRFMFACLLVALFAIMASVLFVQLMSANLVVLP